MIVIQTKYLTIHCPARVHVYNTTTHIQKKCERANENYHSRPSLHGAFHLQYQQNGMKAMQADTSRSASINEYRQMLGYAEL